MGLECLLHGRVQRYSPLQPANAAQQKRELFYLGYATEGAQVLQRFTDDVSLGSHFETSVQELRGGVRGQRDALSPRLCDEQ